MIQNQRYNSCVVVILCTTLIPLYTTSNYFDVPDELDTYADVSYENEENFVQKQQYSLHDKSLHYIRRAICAYVLYEIFFLYKAHTASASYASYFVPAVIKNMRAKYSFSTQTIFILGKAYVFYAIAKTATDILFIPEELFF